MTIRALMRAHACALVALAALGAAAPSAPAALAVKGELIVRFEKGATKSERAEARRETHVKLDEALPIKGMQLVRVARGTTVRAADRALERQEDVLYAEPNFVASPDAVPNDPLFGQLWGLDNLADADIDAPEAWQSFTGSAAVAVGVVDTGIDHNHPDLAANVDAAAGRNLLAEGRAATDAVGHGTHVAGTIGAVGNNGTGVAGVNWRTRMLPLKVCATRFCDHAAMIEAFLHAARKGAKVANVSIGGRGQTRAMRDALTAASGTLFVVSAGNLQASDRELDNDRLGYFPCNYPVANLICVGASTDGDGLAGFSHYGRRTVDLAAPGEGVLSTVPGAQYGSKDGTSMAAPHVAGAAALLFARVAGISVADVRSALLSTTDRLSSMAGRTVTEGRLNLARALAAVAPPEQPPPAPPPPGPAPLPPGDTVGVMIERGGTDSLWDLRFSNTPGPPDRSLTFGGPGAIPVKGDWDGDGDDTVGVFHPWSRVWALRNTNTPGPPDVQFEYGGPGAQPVVGDWDGDGDDTIGVFVPRGGTDAVWDLRNKNDAGPADVSTHFGGPGAMPVTGDWDGDGDDTLGVYVPRGGTDGIWDLRNSNSAGPPDVSTHFGGPDALPVTGDWDGDGDDSLGVFIPRGGTDALWELRNANSAGPPHLSFPYGGPGAKPVPGHWGRP
jgi:thermitase